MGKKAKVFIVDDHPLLREGIAQLINNEEDMAICGETDNADDAIDVITRTEPEVAIVDVSIKGSSGIDLLKEIKDHFPNLAVLMLSMHDESVYAQRALRAGAAGYIMKQEASDRVLVAIRKVLQGGLYLSDHLATTLLHQFVGGRPKSDGSPMQELSDRELEIFDLISQGHGTRPIAEKLNLSVKTVESHRAHIKEKLHLRNSTELVHRAIQWGQTEKI